jgi:hypothetical protein
LNTAAEVLDFSIRERSARPIPEEDPVMMIHENAFKKLSMDFLEDMVRSFSFIQTPINK